MGLVPFHLLYPEDAKREYRMVIPVEDDDLPSRPLMFVECYCIDRNCDCRRTILQVMDVERRAQVATISYAFEPPGPPHEDEPQMFLDPINPQSPLSGALLGLFRQMIADDPEYHARLVRHYTMWKRIMDDPTHPARAGLLAQFDTGARPNRRTKTGPNDPCPCGSGRKHKKCCRDLGNTVDPRAGGR